MKADKLILKNAAENNLKGFDLEIAHDKFVVVTGLSGSGKSSLAFDTIYAEGQRRYIETFSPYTRQFLDKLKKPKIDAIENVRPAIAVEQKTRITNSRSTVGSITNINDYLKIIWGNFARPFCPSCKKELSSWEARSLAAQLKLELPSLEALIVCAPVELLVEGSGKIETAIYNNIKRFEVLGYSRYFDIQDQSFKKFEENQIPSLDSKNRLILVIDRLRPDTSEIEERLRGSIEQAFSVSNGACLILKQNSSQNKFISKEYFNYFCCQECSIKIKAPSNSLFSFNHPLGACAECKGFGYVLGVDLKVCIPDPSKSIGDGAIACWNGDAASGQLAKLHKFCLEQKIPLNKAWHQLTQDQKDLIVKTNTKSFKGINAWFKKLETKLYKMHVRVFMARYRGQFLCQTCHGTRLKKDALNFLIEKKTLPDIWQMQIKDLFEWLTNLKQNLEKKDLIGPELKDVFVALLGRVGFLNDLGLNYLSLDRAARTLSGGETQRVNLATALGSELISTHFVLDEPSVGLHARDTARLIQALKKLQTAGNSLLVVEHDLDCINAADYIIEMGPQAGNLGGQVTYSGKIENWQGIEQHLISPSINNRKSKNFLKIEKASVRNLQVTDLKIPLNNLVCLTGVSGSGKSTLVNEVIQKGFERYQQGNIEVNPNIKLSGFEKLEQVLLVDQSPLIKSPRSNIATYTGMWDQVRDLLASSEQAKSLGLTKSAFSFNVDGGRCPNCKGAGAIKEDMQFLSDVYVQCEFCAGKRFQTKVLEVTYKDVSVSDFLQMSVEQAAQVFAEFGLDHSQESCQTLVQLGLGHLTLGHPLSQLSGGEAQRLKLVPFIQQAGSKPSLLLLDEPTTGLHLHDIYNLINLLRLIRDNGHSIICVEHNLTLIQAADWLIDLGPEGGDQGGQILQQGSPQDFLDLDSKAFSYTAKYLKEYVKQLESKSKEKKKKSKIENLPIAAKEFLEIKGAREHNLKNLNIKVPLDKMVVFTGVSGSGKSSIAKDIIYAEGQRRYLDCLSPYARQFIKELKKPEIDEIKNVMPTICVAQHTFQPTRLSSLATVSEIYNFLRLLYAKAGTQYCPEHDQAIQPLSAQAIAQQIKCLKTKQLRLMAPVIRLKKGVHRAELERAFSSEIDEVRVDGIYGSPLKFLTDWQTEPPAKSKVHSIEFVVARFDPTKVQVDLIQQAVEQALSLSGGDIIIAYEDAKQKREDILSTHRTCPVCKRGFLRPDPEDLSFNSRRGQCSSCLGFGVDASGKTCQDCHGARLNPIGLSIKLGFGNEAKNIYQACLLNALELKDFLEGLEFNQRVSALVQSLMPELESRIQTLLELGLDNIELNRDCHSLSGGELQRLRLAAASSSTLSGVMYIFDEPSAGLHPFDNQKVLAKLRTLQNKGNCVLVIEHDEASIKACDYVIELGPAGGKQGGRIVFEGEISKFLNSKDSITAQALKDESVLNLQVNNKQQQKFKNWLQIKNASKNNIKNLDLKLPLNTLTCVAGVSGAGKSSLVHGIIADTIFDAKPSLKNAKQSHWTSSCAEITSDLEISRVLNVDQSPIGKTSRSTPASYLKIWDEIRKLFANTIEAKAQGYTQSFFSYNSGKGQCPECKGQGQVRLEMSFLADAWNLCEACNGSRYREEAKAVHFAGMNVSDILNLTFEEAKTVFANHRKIHPYLHQACELGLGYLTLGQNSASLSGGESQRLKLVQELSINRRDHTLYILDEPTTGLHKLDIRRLINVLNNLVAAGNTVIVIEHEPSMLLSAQYLIELGPESGINGGKIVYSGTPSAVIGKDTAWGRYFESECGQLLKRAE